MLSTQGKYAALSNSEGRHLWGSDNGPDLNREIQSCLEYAESPTWKIIYENIQRSFGDFKDLQPIELGCGLGKVSLLFSILGARATLVDYSQKQIRAAICLHDYLGMQPIAVNKDLLRLPRTFHRKFDVAMSFGTVEHFFGHERQMVFNAHLNVLKTHGIAVVYVPNKFGIIYQFARGVRKFLGRSICAIEEKAFTRKELIERMFAAGFQDIMVFGGETLSHDVKHFIINYNRLFKKNPERNIAEKSKIIRSLSRRLKQNNQKIKLLNNYFSYPLVAVGKKVS